MKKMTPRKKWELFLAGEDVGPMVSPLCDRWTMGRPYYWPGPDAEPYPEGHPYHALCEQIAMGLICGWDPTFLAGLPLPPRNQKLHPHIVTTKIEGGTRIESRAYTPYGDLTSITENKTSSHAVKAELGTEEDYKKLIWLTKARMDYDDEAGIKQGQELRRVVGDHGILGIWSGPPIGFNHDNIFYHLADWPEAVLELRQAIKELMLRQIVTLRKAGFDYLFYCVDGTEWISPDFFRDYILEDTKEILGRWREMGGFVLWHTCGRIAKLIESDFYNVCLPEIFETMSEPPVGSLPSLKWGREHLDKRIATKGNMPLNILLSGTEEEVRADVRRIRNETRGYRHIVGLSDDILSGTPLKNLRAFVEESRRVD